MFKFLATLLMLFTVNVSSSAQAVLPPFLILGDVITKPTDCPGCEAGLSLLNGEEMLNIPFSDFWVAWPAYPAIQFEVVEDITGDKITYTLTSITVEAISGSCTINRLDDCVQQRGCLFKLGLTFTKTGDTNIWGSYDLLMNGPGYQVTETSTELSLLREIPTECNSVGEYQFSFSSFDFSIGDTTPGYSLSLAADMEFILNPLCAACGVYW